MLQLLMVIPIFYSTQSIYHSVIQLVHIMFQIILQWFKLLSKMVLQLMLRMAKSVQRSLKLLLEIVSSFVHLVLQMSTEFIYFSYYPGDEKIIEYFVSEGADVNVKDNNGLTPLQFIILDMGDSNFGNSLIFANIKNIIED